MLGVIVNTVAIIAGSLIGLLVNRGIPERFSTAIMTALGLVIIYVGVSGALEAENLIIMILSLVLGIITGTGLRLEDRLNTLGQKLEKRFAPSGEGKKKSTFAQGFVSATLLFCVGAMAIVGSINSGLLDDHSIIYAKSTIDFISAIVLTVSFGIGVMFSAFSVLIYQGLLVLLAGLLSQVLYDSALIAELTGAGSLIIVALGLNMIGVSKIKVADFLPTIVFVPILFRLYELIF